MAHVQVEVFHFLYHGLFDGDMKRFLCFFLFYN